MPEKEEIPLMFDIQVQGGRNVNYGRLGGTLPLCWHILDVLIHTAAWVQA